MSGIDFVGSPFLNEFNKSREQSILNQQRQAQAVQMLQEARLKAEMQPYDIQSKLADIRFKDAQSENMTRDKTDPLKKAKATREMLDMLLPEMSTVVNPYEEAMKAKSATGMASALGVSPEGVGGMNLTNIIERMRKVDPESAEFIEKSSNPIDALVQVYKTRMQQTAPQTKRDVANIAGEYGVEKARVAGEYGVKKQGVANEGKVAGTGGIDKEERARLSVLSRNLTTTINNLSKEQSQWDWNNQFSGRNRGAFPQQAELDQARRKLNEINARLEGQSAQQQQTKSAKELLKERLGGK